MNNLRFFIPLQASYLKQLAHDVIQQGSIAEKHVFFKPLKKIDLSGFDLSENQMLRLNLEGADLSYTTLPEDINHVNLKNANLYETFMHNTVIANSNLEHANLENSDVHKSNFVNCNLNHANLGRSALSGMVIYSDMQHVNLVGSKANLHIIDSNTEGTNLSAIQSGEINVIKNPPV